MADTDYESIEDGFLAVLQQDGNPFKTVEVYGGQLSDAELAQELSKLMTMAPAALIYYAGSESNEGWGGKLEEMALFGVLVIAAGRSRQAVLRGDSQSQGVYELLKYCRQQLHNKQDATGFPNPPLWQGNRRVASQESPLTVAAYLCSFKVRIWHQDGPPT